MQDFMKRVRLLSVGLFYMGKEKVEETVADLIKKGEITEKEGKELMNELIAKSRTATKHMEARINKVISDTQERLHAPLKKEIDALKKRVEKLEKRKITAKAKSPRKAAASVRKNN